MSDRTLVATLALALAVLLALSGFAPYDRATWLMETAPIFIAVPILAVSYQRFPLTRFLYVLIFLHAVILLTGGAYTYARVPLGFWLQRITGDDRNPYDKVGHFAQGFVPALVARELFIRRDYVRGRGMTAFLCICVAMFISACYELVEWGAAVAMGQGADEFLGTQGYVWDTQSDMLFALIGSTTAVLLFSRWHEYEIRRISRSSA